MVATSNVRVLARVRPALPHEYQFEQAAEVLSVSSFAQAPSHMQISGITLAPILHCSHLVVSHLQPLCTAHIWWYHTCNHSAQFRHS